MADAKVKVVSLLSGIGYQSADADASDAVRRASTTYVDGKGTEFEIPQHEYERLHDEHEKNNGYPAVAKVDDALAKRAHSFIAAPLVQLTDPAGVPVNLPRTLDEFAEALASSRAAGAAQVVVPEGAGDESSESSSDLDDLNKTELQKLAEDRGVEGFKSMKVDELRDALKSGGAAPNAPDAGGLIDATPPRGVNAPVADRAYGEPDSSDDD